MQTSRVALLALLALTVTTACASAPLSPTPLLPDTLQWFSPPINPAIRAAWVIGAEAKPGIYALRVQLAKGGRIPPHTHPDERHSTVLSGTLYVGFGEVFDESRLVAVPTGAVYVAPANQPHYLLAKDGDVVYQEAGIGPTATVPLKK